METLSEVRELFSVFIDYIYKYKMNKENVFFREEINGKYFNGSLSFRAKLR